MSGIWMEDRKFFVEFCAPFDGIYVYERDLEVRIKIIGDIKGWIRDLPQDFGLKGW